MVDGFVCPYCGGVYTCDPPCPKCGRGPVKPVIYPCGCSHLKVEAGLCDVYDEDGRERVSPEEDG